MSAPAAPNRTQRWREKSVRYRPAGEPGFDPDRYEVAEITKAPARRFVTTHHYTGGYPQTRFQFGLFDTQADNGPELVGVISLGNGSHANALTNPFPSLVPYDESLDLNRMVLRDSVPTNGECEQCCSSYIKTMADLPSKRRPCSRWLSGNIN